MMCTVDAREGLDVKRLGQRVAALREQADLDQQALAEKAYLSRAYISRLERGIVPAPKVTDLQQVANALGKSLIDLLHEPTGETADLFRQLQIFFGPDRADEFEQIIVKVAGMPPDQQDLVAKIIRIQVDGWLNQG